MHPPGYEPMLAATGQIPDDASFGVEPKLEGDIWAFVDSAAPRLLRSYYQPPLLYTGALFNTFAGGGDAPGCRHVFTAEDVVAVSLLGVRIPGRASLSLLDSRADELNELLSAIPLGTTLGR